jgi:hypothetical protein
MVDRHFWLFFAESVGAYLGKHLAQDFVDQELAEPEPGKRYVIGQGLIPHLQVGVDVVDVAILPTVVGR